MPPKNDAKKPDEEIRTLEPRPEDKSDADGANKDDKPSVVDKIVADVEPKTDAFASVRALVERLADEFKGAALLGQEEAHELAEQFASKAEVLAKAALANVEDERAKLLGFDRQQRQSVQPAHDQPELADPPHNKDAVEAAVKLGMSEEDARAMTHMGANT